MIETKEEIKVGDLVKFESYNSVNTKYHNHIALIVQRVGDSSVYHEPIFCVIFLGDTEECQYSFYRYWMKKIS